MSDIILEVVRSVILLGIIVYLLNVGRGRIELSQKGWRLIIAGFLLLLFGSVVDITDNFKSLNKFIVIGDTPAQAFLEKMVGFLGGFFVLAIGLVRWAPAASANDSWGYLCSLRNLRTLIPNFSLAERFTIPLIVLA